jgi:hypothetical protein
MSVRDTSRCAGVYWSRSRRRVLVALAQVGLRDHADEPPVVVGDDDHVVRPLADDPLHVAQRGRGRDDERRVDARVRALDVADDARDRPQVHVLRQHAQAAEPRHGLGHALARDRVHVRRHHRVRAAGEVLRGQVDLRPRPALEAAGDDEHVVEAELERLVRLGVQEAHGSTSCPRS